MPLWGQRRGSWARTLQTAHQPRARDPVPPGEFCPLPWAAPAATPTFSASPAGLKCTFPPRCLRDSGQPSCSAQVTSWWWDHDRAKWTGQASLRRAELGPTSLTQSWGRVTARLGSRAGAPLPRRPVSSPGNWSRRQDFGLPSRPPGSEILSSSSLWTETWVPKL